MSFELPVFKNNLHWNSLYDFHVVAGRVLRGKQAEARTAGAGNTVDVPVIFPPVGINVNINRLTWPHGAQLVLLKVCCHPHVLERDDFHHFLASLDVLPHFHRAIADYPGALPRASSSG